MIERHYELENFLRHIQQKKNLSIIKQDTLIHCGFQVKQKLYLSGYEYTLVRFLMITKLYSTPIIEIKMGYCTKRYGSHCDDSCDI